MKKLLLSLGTIAAVVAPVASIVACGTSARDEAISKLKKVSGYSDKSDEEKKVFDEFLKLAKTEDLTQESVDSKESTVKIEKVLNLGIEDLEIKNNLKFEKEFKSPIDFVGRFELNFNVTKDGEIESVKVNAGDKVKVMYGITTERGLFLSVNDTELETENMDSPYDVSKLSMFEKTIQEIALKGLKETKEHKESVLKKLSEEPTDSAEVTPKDKEKMDKMMKILKNAKNCLDYFNMIHDSVQNNN